MTRLRTFGWEVNSAFYNTAPKTGNIDPGSNGAVAAVLDTTIFRSGASSLKCDSTAANSSCFAQLNLLSAESVLGRRYFVRAYFRVTNLPNAGASQDIIRIHTTADVALVGARLASTGKLQLFNAGAGTQIGSDSAETIVANNGQWHMVELSCLIDTGTIDTAEARLNGVSIASGSALALSDVAIGIFYFGWRGAGGASKVINIDDGAINDDQGSNQNSWPGEGRVVLLKPVSDNARDALWTTNAGTTTGLFNGVANTPPVGIAAATTPDNKYIKHAGGSAGTTDRYDANMTDYITAGISPSDTITLVQGVVNAAEESTTGAKLISFECLSNPVIATTGSFDVAPTTGNQGIWPTLWATKWGPAAYNPAVTFGTQPVMRVVRPETAARVASVDFMGLYVEYVQAIYPPYPWRTFHRTR
jgi:hypothetical protein